MKNATPPSDREFVGALLAAATAVTSHLEHPLSYIKGISLSEYQLLSALAEQHEATATRVDLANALQRTPSGVTRALRPLEKLGYVETKKDDRDARRSLATLTRHGEKLVKESSKLIDEAVSDLAALRSVDDGDRERLQRLLNELAR